MTVANIITEFGAYYLKSDVNKNRLFTLIRAASITASVFTPIVTDDTVYRASEARMTRVLQPFQKAFTPINGLSFEPSEIKMYKMKIDASEYPDDLEATWLGFLADKSLSRKDWPFVRWYVEEHLIPQAKEDYELLEVFAGVFAAPTDGTAGAAGTSMNGIKKQLADYITAGRITPITTGAPSATNTTWVGQVEGFADNMNTKYWGVKQQLCMSEMNARKFARGYQEKYGKDTNYKDGKGEVPFTNLTVIGLPSMNGSNRIWCTPKNNAVRLMKKSENMDSMNIENVDRQVKFYTDWYDGVGFIIPEIVFCNDQV